MITDVIVQDAGAKGLGVFAKRDFTPGEFIFRRRYGRIVRNQDLGLLSEEDQRHLCEAEPHPVCDIEVQLVKHCLKVNHFAAFLRD